MEGFRQVFFSWCNTTNHMSSVPHPHVTVSRAGDILFYNGPAQPVLFVPRDYREAFLASPQAKVAIEINGTGASALAACLAAGAALTDAQRDPLALRLRLPNGLGIFYVSAHSTLFHPRNTLAPAKDDLIVTPDGIAPLSAKNPAEDQPRNHDEPNPS